MRFNIMEGNRYAATVAAAYGYDVIGRTCGKDIVTQFELYSLS